MKDKRNWLDLFDHKPYLRAIVEPGCIILALVILFATFNYMMELDAENLCSSEATAYAECGQ